MFLLLVAVVGEDFPQFAVGGGRDALVVPVDGLEFLHERRDGAMALDDVGRQQFKRLVESFARHNRDEYPARLPG